MSIWTKKMKIEYKTPSGRLAPYPDMDDDDLDEFEEWAKEIDGDSWIFDFIEKVLNEFKGK